MVTGPSAYHSGFLLSNDFIGEKSFNGYEHNRLFRNDGNRQFTDVAVGLGVDATEDGRSSLFFDMDNDGDLDLLVSNMNQTLRLYRNDRGNQRNWLKVQATSTNGNSFAVGATIRVMTGEKTLVRPVVAGQGFQTSYVGPVHFGLGDQEAVDVEVIFPGGERVRRNNVTANQTIVIAR